MKTNNLLFGFESFNIIKIFRVSIFQLFVGAVKSDKILLLFTTVLFTNLIEAQNPTFQCNIELQNGKSIKSNQWVKQFLHDSILIATKLADTKIYVDMMFPAKSIKSITLQSKPKSGPGVLRGFIVGAIIGTTLGILVSTKGAPSSCNGNWCFNFDLTPSRGQSIVFAYLITIPVSTLVGGILGGRKHRTFNINGDINAYNVQVEQMKSTIMN